MRLVMIMIWRDGEVWGEVIELRTGKHVPAGIIVPTP